MFVCHGGRPLPIVGAIFPETCGSKKRLRSDRRTDALARAQPLRALRGQPDLFIALKSGGRLLPGSSRPCRRECEALVVGVRTTCRARIRPPKALPDCGRSHSLQNPHLWELNFPHPSSIRRSQMEGSQAMRESAVEAPGTVAVPEVGARRCSARSPAAACCRALTRRRFGSSSMHCARAAAMPSVSTMAPIVAQWTNC